MFGIFRRKSVTEKRDSVSILGSGMFRKLGSGVKNWKQRIYKIDKEFNLHYYDPKSNELKGTMNIKGVAVKLGDFSHIKASGISINNNAIPLSVVSLDDSRNLELVFDTLDEAKSFIQFLSRGSELNNFSVIILTIIFRLNNFYFYFYIY